MSHSDTFGQIVWREWKQHLAAFPERKGAADLIALIDRNYQQATQESPRASNGRKSSRNGGKPMPDELWLTALEADPTYQGVDIRRELGKAQAWAGTSRRPMTKRRFILWLNNALDRQPVAVNGAGQSSNGVKVPDVYREPANWRGAALLAYPGADFSGRTWDSLSTDLRKTILSKIK